MSTQPTPQQWELEWTFGDRVRKARRVLGLTTAQLGQVIGLSAQGVSNLEGRPGTPRAAFTIAKQIEEAYGVPAWWMLGHEESPGPSGPGDGVHRLGFEPRTHWLTDARSQNVIPFPEHATPATTAA